MFSVVERAHVCCGSSILKRNKKIQQDKCVKRLRFNQTEKLSNSKAYLEKPRQVQHILT